MKSEGERKNERETMITRRNFKQGREEEGNRERENERKKERTI